VTANRAITKYLLDKGFTEVVPPKTEHRPRGFLAFEGILPKTQCPFRVRIVILDWDFIDYPRIELLDHPDGFRPHVDGQGGLCYVSSGSIVFDRQQPVANLEHCLTLAAEELERQANPDYRQDESRYEFIRYWSDIGCCMRGTVSPQARLHRTNLAFIEEENRLIISDLSSEIAKIQQVITQKQESAAATTFPAWVISLDQDPWLDRHGPPGNWGELWKWINMIDPRSADSLYSLVSMKEFAETALGVIVFRYGSKWFGVWTKIDLEIRQTRALAKQKRGGRSSLDKYLKEGRGTDIKVITFSTIELTQTFIHGRNLAGGDGLSGVRIHLVGGGAIGGFLAQQLSRLGAGAGDGELRIIDQDYLSTENLGRHVLGVDMLLKPKATALAEFLIRQFPMANIKGDEEDARRVPDLFECDLLIDATGEEALSLVLNEIHQERLQAGACSPAMLFVWVLGNGEVVQGLLSDGGNHACYDCLNLPDGDELTRQRFRVLKQLPETRFVGCHAMRPYAVTAPVTAAALAAQMAIDWKTGNPKPRFRTQYLTRGAHLFNLKSDSDPERLGKCRTCSVI
jgi:hypothetical protein